MIPTLTLNNGHKIPRLGLGTWTIGGLMTRVQNNDDVGQIESIKYAINKGITLIRTAQNYAAGHCEELVGEAIKGFDREKLFIIDSIFEGNVKDDATLITEVQKSLKRLRTSYVDLLIIGGIDQNIPIHVVGNALKKAQSLGLANSIGVGNYRLDELKVLHDILGDNLSYNEMQYSLIVREPIIHGELSYQANNSVVLGAYRPLQLGQLAKSGIGILDNLAKKYHKTQAEISIKWILSQDNTITFPKATTMQHIDQIVGMYDWTISPEDIVDLTDNFPIQMRTGDCIAPINSFIR